MRGRHYTSVVAREETRRARELFTQKILGTVEVTDTPATLVNTDGSRLDVEISAVPLRRGGHVIGVFGQFADVPDDAPTVELAELTPRQHEVLRLLERGYSTDQIAAELSISKARCATMWPTFCAPSASSRGSRRSRSPKDASRLAPRS